MNDCNLQIAQQMEYKVGVSLGIENYVEKVLS